MNKIILAAMLSVVSVITGMSQSDVDALRYSRTFPEGTARFVSMGGAFGTLGADFSTSSTNPAGLGLYTKSEFTVTPAMFNGSTKSDFNGVISRDSKFNFNMGNVGVVIASPRSSENKSFIKNYQFAFGVNRSNNFNNRMLMEGVNNQNSIVDTYVDRANGIFFGDIEDDNNGYYAYDLNPAWYTFMIDTLPGSDDQYYGTVPSGSDIIQHKEINSWGSMNEMVLAFSANFGDRLYLGFSMGFPFIRYFQESYYTEMDQKNQINDFNRLSIYDNLATTGSGFNLKFGTIVRVTDMVRLGAAIHSPTWFNNMNDEWYSEYSTSFDNGDAFYERTPIGYYDYQLETPWKAIAGLSFVLGKMALISAEYEFSDFSKSRLSSWDYSFYEENTNIRTRYNKSHSFRLGTEIMLGLVSVRGGGGYYSSPFVDEINDGSKYYFSGGVGYREKSFFMDIAYQQSIGNEDYYLYGSENVSVNPIDNRYSTYKLLTTIGFRF